MAAWVSTQAKSVIFIYLFIYLYFICHTDKLHDNNIQKRFKNNGEEAKRKLYSLCLVSYNFSKMR